MKKKSLFLLLILLFTFGCNVSDVPESTYASEVPKVTKPLVRFQNMTEDFTFRYGVRFGDAEFLFTSLNPFVSGTVTEYKTATEGDYTIQGKTINGDWLTLFALPYTISNGGEYTVAIRSNYNNTSIESRVITDKVP